MANTVLRKDYSGSGNRQRQTISVWVKKAGLGGNQAIFSVRHTGNSNYYGYLRFKSDDSLQYFTNTPSVNLITNRKFRDVNAWYHIVIATDTTQLTEADRVKMYVNGVQETSLNTATYPSENGEVTFGDNYRHEIGSYDASYYFNGCLSHFHFITNTTYQASTFGSTDSTTGEWQINTSPTVTYATNSFFLLKDGNSVTDQSGQGNNWTVGGGTLTKTEDNPSNVFATMNPLQNLPSANTYSQGNNTVTYTVHNDLAEATLGMTSGKYYWEQKFINATGGNNAMVGVGNENAHRSAYLGADTTGWSYYAVSGTKYHNGSNSSYGATFTAGDIIGVAFDADTRTIWFSKNGTWQNSATISEIGAGTTTNSAYTGMGSAGDLFLPVTSGYNGNVISWNFGNGYFGTTAVSSAGTNASGIGIFEYDVPTGFTALSTKGLNL